MKFATSFVLVALVAAASAVNVQHASVRPVRRAPAAAAPPHPAAPAAPAKCPCKMPGSVTEGFKTSNSPVMKATAVEARKPDRHYNYMVMRVKVAFRGCPPSGKYIVVKTPKTAGACGVTYTQGTTYAVTAKLARSSTPPPGLPSNMEVYTATSCGYNKAWTDCPKADKTFLYYHEPSCSQ